MAEPALHPPTGTPDARRRPFAARARPIAARRLPTEAELPFEDDEPLAETDFQLKPLGYAYYGLAAYFAGRADVAVQADMFVHYEAADGRGKPPYRSLAPDVFVSFGVAKRDRMSYVVWEEGKPPDFVLEVLSPSTWRRDMVEKKAVYEGMGVREYWVFDPERAHLKHPPLAGFALAGDAYRPIEPEEAGGAAFASQVLGLVLRVREGALRILDPATGEEFLTPGELAIARQEAEEAHQLETAAREAAEQRADANEAAREAAEQRANANQAAREAAEQRANANQAAREAAERRADEQQAAHQAAQDRIARLEALLHGGDDDATAARSPQDSAARNLSSVRSPPSDLKGS